MAALSTSYYLSPDVVGLACDLLGKALCLAAPDGSVLRRTIIETEAYCGAEDRASHAYNNRRTARTEVMFHEGGVAYVYLCYGIHHLLNVVTGPAETPHAVLIRSVEGVIGPGRLAVHYGITRADSGLSLQGPRLWIEECVAIAPTAIVATPRIGVDYAGPDAAKPWRFCLKERSR